MQEATDPAWTMLPIAAVERETGLGKDTLRAWERRYGFPSPTRNARGDRAYTWSQVERLRRMSRLVLAGHRPGQLARLTLDELEALARAESPPDPARLEVAQAAPPLLDVDDGLSAMRAGGSPALRRWMQEALGRAGLSAFVRQGVAPLLPAIGRAWLDGHIQVFEEHLFSEALQSVLRHALLPLQATPDDARPRVLLAVAPGEEHVLGVLMAECLVTLEGATCTSLGRATPVPDIVAAAVATRADVVALGFSARLGLARSLAVLEDLRRRLPDTVELWAGGAAVAPVRTRPAGGWRALDLGDIAIALADWRGRQIRHDLPRPATS